MELLVESMLISVTPDSSGFYGGAALEGVQLL